MTDQELIHHLRHSKGWPTLGNAAADRIEALEAERDKWRAYAHLYSAWVYEVGQLLEERREELDPDSPSDKALLALMDQAKGGIIAAYRATEEQG